jgi:hypothetical protein
MASKRVPVTQAAQLGVAGGEASFFKPVPTPAAAAAPDPAPAPEPVLAPAPAPAAGPATSSESVQPPAALARPRRSATPKAAKAPAARPGDAEPEEMVACQIYVPADVLQRAWGLLRPSATGARRGVSKTLMIAAYARAIHSHDLDIDTTGLERGMDKEATRRVLAALKERFHDS